MVEALIKYKKGFSMHYRSDIDGLRTVAVMSVVIFHFFPEVIPGGFIGVDIFFVISGYLISSILIKDLTDKKFSIITFYKKRVLRIFPALFFVLAVVYIIGWFTLTQGDYSTLGKHIAGGSFFLSNILLWSESGYFDTSSQLKPLLHLWSLGVEEQFYLLWPLVLMLFTKIRKNIAAAGVTVLILSFAFSVHTMNSTSGVNYYSPMSRAWELMFGSLLAIYMCKREVSLNRTFKNLASFIGAALIIISLYFIDESMPFPGYIAILPVCGASILILSEGGAFNKLLSYKPIVYIGIISYPLYLWHWPLYSFSRIALGDDLTTSFKVTTILICFALAIFTYEVIEKSVKIHKNKPFLSPSLAAMVFSIGIIGITTSALNGFGFRAVNGKLSDYTSISSPYEYFKFSENLRNGVCHSVELIDAEKNGCISHHENQLFLWGDSYAASMFIGLKDVMTTRKIKAEITQATDGNGAPFFRDDFYTDSGKTLTRANEEKLKLVSKIKPRVVVISWMTMGKNAQRNMSTAAEQIIKLSKNIKQNSPNTKLYVVGPLPEWKDTLLREVIKYYKEKDALPPTITKYGLRQDPFIWDGYFKTRLNTDLITYISAIDSLCGESGCVIRNGNGPENLVAVDWGHLSASGSKLLMDRIASNLLHDLH